MSDHVSKKVWIVGAGPIGRAHAKAALRLGTAPLVVARSSRHADRTREETGLTILDGGLEKALSSGAERAEMAIVACEIESMPGVTCALLNAGIGRILVEKPAGVDAAAIGVIAAAARKRSAQVFVAYNRRFLASTRRAREIVREDGGVSSFNFDFTELANVVQRTAHPATVKANWFLANSSHVVDLAFFLCGRPDRMNSLATGSLSWHPAARFAGSGHTKDGALFHYGADWTSAGRWTLEINTGRRKIIMRPLEQLRIQRAGSFDIEDVMLGEDDENGLKPGFLGQLRAFLGRDDADLLEIHALHDLAENEYRAIVTGRDFEVRPA